MKHIIVISGKQYSGKDTFAKILLEKLPSFKRVGIGDAIKIRYAEEKDLTLEEIEKNKHLYRNDLIGLGNYGRNIDKMYWLKELARLDYIIVPDIRVRDEIAFFKSLGAFCIRINSSYENRSKRGIVVENNDLTEIDLDNYTGWDIVIDNNSSYEDLIPKADKVCMLYNSFIG